MADHGWNADGAAGDVATGSTAEDGTDAAKAAAPNVVPFPGDWIGPLDELVPIDLEPPEEDRPRASAFWDGDPTAVHEAIGSAAPRGGSTRTRVGSTTPGSASGQPPPVTGTPAWPPYRRRNRSWPLLASGLLAVLLTGFFALVVSHGTGSHGSGRAELPKSTTAAVAPKSATTAVRVRAAAKPKRTTGRTGTKPVSATKSVTVTQRVPLTPAPVRQTVEITPTPAVVEHVAAAPPRSPVTSRPARSESCTMSPDSGCLP